MILKGLKEELTFFLVLIVCHAQVSMQPYCLLDLIMKMDVNFLKLVV